ncbi:MAG: AAA-like domain protein [Candidatus Syntrophoarchaeum sp. GoM_oil]|nr:MAG: AAA-like domain protein [Candidatus Syntrophoarchaeum sp. GoM_oil]
MLLDIKEKRIITLGLQGSGKTHFTKALIAENTQLKPLIVDPLKEYNIKGTTTYRPTHRNYEQGSDEIGRVIREKLIKPYETHHAPLHSLFVIDECNRYAPNKKPLSSEISYLNDFSRHMKLSTVYIARRPTHLNTDLVELAHILIIFSLNGAKMIIGISRIYR